MTWTMTSHKSASSSLVHQRKVTSTLKPLFVARRFIKTKNTRAVRPGAPIFSRRRLRDHLGGHQRSRLTHPARVQAASENDSARQTFIHIHQSIITASNSNQVYCILINLCIWINLSCGDRSDRQQAARACLALHTSHHVMP